VLENVNFLLLNPKYFSHDDVTHPEQLYKYKKFFYNVFYYNKCTLHNQMISVKHCIQNNKTQEETIYNNYTYRYPNQQMLSTEENELCITDEIFLIVV